jgi:hypothetical protein
MKKVNYNKKRFFERMFNEVRMLIDIGYEDEAIEVLKKIRIMRMVFKYYDCI